MKACVGGGGRGRKYIICNLLCNYRVLVQSKASGAVWGRGARGKRLISQLTKNASRQLTFRLSCPT